MAIDYDKLGELIDGYGGISADDLNALPEVHQTEIDLELNRLRCENKRLRKALAEVELILVAVGDVSANGLFGESVSCDRA